jgi:hypothetical protein
MAARLSRDRVEVGSGGREDPLPRPLARGTGVFSVEGVGQGNGTSAAAEVAVVLFFDSQKVETQPVDQDGGKHGTSVLLAFTSPDDYLTPVQVQVFHTQTQGLEKAQATAVKEGTDQPRNAVDLGQHQPDLLSAENHGDVLGPFGVDQVSQPRKFALQDLLVEKQQGSQRLILGRRADVSFGETRKKGANLGLGQGFGMALAVEDDEAPNPSDVGLLGARAIVTGSQAFPDLVKKTRWLGRKSG